jgi:hypothetical protein
MYKNRIRYMRKLGRTAPLHPFAMRSVSVTHPLSPFRDIRRNLLPVVERAQLMCALVSESLHGRRSRFTKPSGA